MQTDDSYKEFLLNKMPKVASRGFEVSLDNINDKLFPFQKAIVKWAIQLGKAAIFAECGLGKTAMQLEWANHIARHTKGKVLILAPLAVSGQTVREGAKFGINAVYVKEHEQVKQYGSDCSIFITNYERLDKFDCDDFAGIVLDESSILKDFSSKTKQAIVTAFANTPYKLACTATPSPNDHQELCNHAEFLDLISREVMLSTWFIHDSGKTSEWRLKKHAVEDFWRWITSWAVCISKPGDLGSEYDMPEFVLPEINIQEHFLRANQSAYERAHEQGMLFPSDAPSAIKIHKVKKESLGDRVAEARAIVDKLPSDTPILIWCDTNYESDALLLAIPEAIEVRGSDTVENKEQKLLGFADGKIRILLTKPSIAGFGMNFQNCCEMVFVGVSYSFELFYQAIRRSWRYGQKNVVNAHIIYSETEGNVIKSLNNKREKFAEMQAQMNKTMSEYGLFRDFQTRGLKMTEKTTLTEGMNWKLYLGDCVQAIKELGDNSIDHSVYSPPFSNLFVYSDNIADMGNCANDDEFFEHYKFLIRDLLRVTKPGKITSVHCSDLPIYKWKDGAIGIKDLSGKIIQAYIDEGWVYHNRITIWKDPVVEMQRTKANGLLHKTFANDCTSTRAGLPDYVVEFRKWDDIESREKVQQQREYGDYVGTSSPELTGNTDYSIDLWQKYASPVWFDIDQGRTLNYRIARTDKDEKHLCPLQLDVIARLIDWRTKKGDVVLSPFAGIGSEGYEAVRMGRKFIGFELKPEYYNIACNNLREIEEEINRPKLF